MQWADLGAAFAPYLVLEGIMSFLNPQGLKRILSQLVELADGPLGIAGAISMPIGKY